MKIGAIVFTLGVILIFAGIIGFYYTLSEAGNKTITYSLSPGELKNKTIYLKENTTYEFSFSADFNNVYFSLYSPGGKKIVEGNMEKNNSFNFKPKESGNYVLNMKNMENKNNRIAVVVLKSGELEGIHNMMLNYEIMFFTGVIAAVVGIVIALFMRK